MIRRLATSIAALLLLGCGSDGDSAPKAKPAQGRLGRPADAPVSAETQAEAAESVETPSAPAKDPQTEMVAPSEEPDKRPGPVVDESVQAFGKRAFELLRTGDRDGFLGLTNYANAAFKEACPRLHRDAGLESQAEVDARFEHCRKVIDWSAVEAATVAGGELTGESAGGCANGVAALEPIRMRVKTPKGIFAVDLFQAVAREGEVIGISGAIKCAPLR
jgi:hypothetical protein